MRLLCSVETWLISNLCVFRGEASEGGGVRLEGRFVNDKVTND